MRTVLATLVLAVASFAQSAKTDDLVQALMSNDVAKRRSAATALGGTYPDGAAGVRVLIDALEDSDASVREAAGRALAALGRKGLFEHQRLLTNPKDPAYASLRKINEVFGQMGGALNPAELAWVVSDNENGPTRRAGAASCVIAGLIPGSEVSVDILVAALNDADARAMAAATITILGWSAASGEHPATKEELAASVRVLKAEKGPGVIAAAGICILQPRKDWPKEVVEFPLTPPVEEQPKLDDLIAQFERLDFAVRRQVYESEKILRMFRNLGPAARGAAPVLKKRLAEGDERLQGAIAATLLAVSPGAEKLAVSTLAKIVREPTPRAWTALEALESIGPKAAPVIPTLILVLDWKDPDVDFSAANLPARAAELGSAMWTVRLSKRHAVLILGRLGAEAEAAKPALESLHESKDPRLRYRAKNALRKIGK